jgi:hypothetical protein
MRVLYDPNTLAHWFQKPVEDRPFPEEMHPFAKRLENVKPSENVIVRKDANDWRLGGCGRAGAPRSAGRAGDLFRPRHAERASVLRTKAQRARERGPRCDGARSLMRVFTGDELRVLRALWGRNALEVAATGTLFMPGAFNGRPACFLTDEGQIVVYCDPVFGVACLAHEVGHAIHYTMFPESRTGWSVEKCETFAMLSTANALRQSLRLGYVPMTALDRALFALHARSARQDRGVYHGALREAYRIAKSPFLSRQITEVAYGRPN